MESRCWPGSFSFSSIPRQRHQVLSPTSSHILFSKECKISTFVDFAWAAEVVVTLNADEIHLGFVSTALRDGFVDGGSALFVIRLVQCTEEGNKVPSDLTASALRTLNCHHPSLFRWCGESELVVQ